MWLVYVSAWNKQRVKGTPLNRPLPVRGLAHMDRDDRRDGSEDQNCLARDG